MALTIEQVHAAADQLAEQGKRPTLAAVRSALGGGSFTTISEAMQSWREQQAEEHELAAVEVPAPISERVEQLQAAIWQAAVAEAERRLQAERAALAEAQAAAAAEVADAQEAVATLEAEAEERDAQLTGLIEDLRQAEQDNGKLQDELRQVEQEASSLAQRIALLEASERRLEEQLVKSEAREQQQRDLIARHIEASTKASGGKGR